MKILALATCLFLSFLAHSQMYHSSEYEIIDLKTTKTVKSDNCSIDFMVDTAGKAVTMTNLTTGKISVVYLVHKSSIILSNGQFTTWGYSIVKTTSSVKKLSFTQFSSGKLVAINLYNDTTAIMFYISEKYNL